MAEGAGQLGKALVWALAILDPELVVFGHPGDLLGDRFMNPLREAILAETGEGAKPLPRLVGSKLGAKLDDVAALMAVVDNFRHRGE